MEEIILRVTGVSTWLILALMGYGLFIHDRKRWGKACLAASLTALSIMALQPWGTQQAMFDAVAPEHGHTPPAHTKSGHTSSYIEEHKSPVESLRVEYEGTKLGEVYLKVPTPKSKPVVVSFH